MRENVTEEITIETTKEITKEIAKDMKEDMTEEKNPIYQKFAEEAAAMQPRSVALRRDLHKYPETGWLEMRTTVHIVRRLRELGYQILTGREVCLAEARLGLPDAETLHAHAKTVLQQGVREEELTPELREGFTGAIGILDCGPGPVIALRFDIDALGMVECPDESHRPIREGFASVNAGMMHACGHDAHITIGLGTAELLMKHRAELHGKIKLIFQPGEEGGRGAAPIVAHGHLDDVDYLIGNHIAPTGALDDGDITPGTYGSLANTKYDVYYRGVAAHAGGFPERGRNALLAAAQASLGLYAIPRHSDGVTRVNVGTLQAGTGRNVIPDRAKMEIEVRGETTEINEYMMREAEQICRGAAAMQGCSCEMRIEGRGESQQSDEALWQRIAALVKRALPQYTVSSTPNAKNWGSEDISLMMNRVQSHGGQATYMRTMTDMASEQHTVRFDFDERVLALGITLFTSIVYDLCG